MSVSRETRMLLDQYGDLIRKWNPAINLVAPGTISDLEHRHIRDSAQLFELASPKQGNWIDLGSGGGLPGVVIAIFAINHPITITLVESDKRKSAFLATVRRELNLKNLQIKAARMEDLAQGAFKFASARALASLENLMPNLSRQLAEGGEAWLLKGKSWQQEVDQAKENWSFNLETYKSRTDPESMVLKLRNISQNA